MASISQRNGKWRVRIIRIGSPPITKTFITRRDADQWARLTESAVERGLYICPAEAQRTTLADALDRYKREVSIHKKSHPIEKYYIQHWRGSKLAPLALSAIRGSDIAQYRDMRLKAGLSPTSVKHELALMSHLFSVASRDWGMESLSNPVKAIRQPVMARGRERRVPSPTTTELVQATLRGIRHTHGSAQRQVAPAVKEDVVRMVAGLEGVKGIRDRALLLVGFAGAFRRSELVSLTVADIEMAQQGMVINLRFSKTDQEGRGRKVAIPYARGAVCPVLNLQQWLEVAKITEGPVFRAVNRHGIIAGSALTPQAVALVIKERAQAVGLDPAKYSGHSLRSGLVTSAAQLGVSSWKIRAQTGHKSDAMLARYIRDSQIFIDNAAGAVL